MDYCSYIINPGECPYNGEHGGIISAGGPRLEKWDNSGATWQRCDSLPRRLGRQTDERERVFTPQSGKRPDKDWDTSTRWLERAGDQNEHSEKRAR